MMKGILEGKEIKYGGKVLGNKKLLAIAGAGLAVGVATVVVLDKLVKNPKKLKIEGEIL